MKCSSVGCSGGLQSAGRVLWHLAAPGGATSLQRVLLEHLVQHSEVQPESKYSDEIAFGSPCLVSRSYGHVGVNPKP